MSAAAHPPAVIERSAGGVVVRRIEGDIHVLLIRDPYRKWGLPKGHLEQDEVPGEAAVREVREETGLRGLILGPKVDRIDWYFRQDGRLVHKFCTFFLVHSPDGDTSPETTEGITECVWLTFDAATRRISYENTRTVLDAAQRMLLDDPAALRV